jgi:hypothetical protein
VAGAPPGEEHRAPGPGKGLGHPRDRLGRRAEPGPDPDRLHGDVGQRLHLDVEREAEQDRTALDQRGAVGPAQVVADGGRGGDPVREHADRRGQAGLVDVAAGRRLGGLGREDEQRGAGFSRLGQAGQRVGQSGALADAEHADLAADPRVGVGHHGGGPLVAGGHEARAAGGQGADEAEVAAAGQAEHGAHADVPDEGGADPFGDGCLGHPDVSGLGHGGPFWRWTLDRTGGPSPASNGGDRTLFILPSSLHLS